ncbi:MAG: GAF domain-containing protein [Xenococcaceae cyanobacterium MO_207.B15]|nr:GAF domain-containing protein [Xenococcaceae cyanobacterium MO_207.B15]
MVLEPSLSLSEIVRNNKQPRPKDLIGEIVEKIRRVENKETILATSVEIVYQALECDRVVIYSLETPSQGKIVAEAVTPGLARILGTVIKDPCFDAKYIEKYKQGRIRAINDIYKEPGMSLCYLENLEKIDVKANVVVPLINYLDQTLYGLLVAHQCSNARQWQQSEINLMLQVADWAIEQIVCKKKYQQLEEKLNSINRWQTSFTEITQKIHACKTTSEVLNIAVTEAQKVLNCDRVVIYGLQKPDLGKIVAESSAFALAPILGNFIKDPCFEYRYLDKYKQGRVRAINNIYEAGMSDCYVENLEKIAVKSNVVVPINWDDGEIYGLLVAHQCFAFKEWTAEEIEILRQLGSQTGLSLSKTKLKEQIQSINSSDAILEEARDTITIAKSKIQQIQQPIENTTQPLVEISNLNKLLHREINLINQAGTVRSKKETKLIQIILKKLSINIVNLKNAIDLFNNKSKKIEEILEDVAVSLYNKVDRD